MGALTGLLGFNGGAGGTGFAAPSQGTPIVQPTSYDQIQGSYRQSQDALAQQNALLQALQGQNGVGNQNQVYGQLQGVVNGTGPNPAQTMLNQATGQNVSNQAALMAGQRGAGSNVGLIARQAAQTGAAAQQNAAGQAATMQANQSLNALNSAGNIANTQVANQIGATTANTGAQQAEQQQLLNAQAQANNANVGIQSNINSGNTALADTAQKGQQGIIGGLLQGAGTIIGMADGGDVVDAPIIAAPTPVGAPLATQSNAAAPQSNFGKFLKGMGNAYANNPVGGAGSSADSGANAIQSGMSSFVSGIGRNLKPSALDSQETAGLQSSVNEMSGGSGAAAAIGQMPIADIALAKGGKVPALVSPGEKYLSPKDVKKVERGANPMKVGETIKGKPSVGGAKNSYANDTVKKDLQEGGIVVPRSETKSKNPDKDSAQFVAAVLAKRKARR